MTRFLPTLFVLSALSVVSCNMRDLHDTAGSMLEFEGSWHHSLGEPNMYNATVMMHHADGETRGKEYLSRPNGANLRVSRGEYDVMVFNGIMESEQETNLDHVFFRGTDRLSTFEACAVEVAPIGRLGKEEGEYIASNDMELFTFAHHRVSVEADEALYVRYHNGKRNDGEGDARHAGKIESAPRAMSFYFRVRMTSIVNPVSARSAVGALRGFKGSAYMPASGELPRPGIMATHHVNMSQPTGSRTRVDGDGVERGTLVSPNFVSFGPPLPADGNTDDLPASGQYHFEPVFVLNDGEEFAPGRFDVTDQVNCIIERILEHHGDGEDIAHEENFFEIVIDDEITLPIVSGGNGPQISVDPWEDEEIIIIWIRS